MAAAMLLAACAGSAAGDKLTRYRGNYTFGHEVSVFCPAVSSQCYWLSGNTPGELRAALRQLTEERTSSPYKPICVVVEGFIDRDSPRSGFAADYDGLVTLSRIYGPCEETAIVTQGDLQHHRWVLETINGEALQPVEPGERIPELDFGEQMRVSGSIGCNTISGTAVLREEYFVIERLIATGRLCGPAANEPELAVQTVLGSESLIRLRPDRALVLKSSAAELRFRLQDWVD